MTEFEEHKSREDGFWVFAYGSLMWRPGFVHTHSVHASLPGCSRSLCIYSYVHRGTKRHPGLVLGLDMGSGCQGIAYHVPMRHRHEVIAYLRRREQVTKVYKAALRQVTLHSDEHPREVRALCYVVDRRHRQYAGQLPLDVQVQLVRRSKGRSGANIDYVVNTVQHLRDCGIFDRKLELLVTRLGRHRELSA